VKPARTALLAAVLVAASVVSLPAVAAGEGGRAKLALDFEPQNSARDAGGKLGATFPRYVLAVEIDGAIGPATARHLKEALTTAGERRAGVVILRLNTPGGLVTSMREIIADVLASSVPVVGYVAPSGAHAASAGTYLMYATHIAAMAPGTNLGAATPVEIGSPLPGLPGGSDRDRDGSDRKDGKSPPPSASKDSATAKATNDAVAFIRSLAELRGRNADWAEKAVREADSLSASKALEAGVIDLIANNTTELLERIDGRIVEIAGGTKLHLATKQLPVETLQPGWLIRLLSVITNPNIAFILVLVGIYGLIFEFSSPGAVAPGVVGTISLLLGLYALNLLPIDYTGLALMLLGIAFLIMEAFNPTVVLGLGGLVAFLLGAAVLFRVEAPGYRLSWTLVGTTAVMVFGLIMLAGRTFWIVRRGPARVGVQAMYGLPAKILDWRGNEGHVLAQGERWQACGEEIFKPGEIVEVAAVKSLTLMVRRRPGPTASDGELL
jgi:membrane-bound serine protease (ClpP class)